MTTDQTEIELLNGLDRKLSALLAITVHRALIEDTDLANPRPRSIDKLLSDAGLSQREIATLLGKSVSAVSQMLAKE